MRLWKPLAVGAAIITIFSACAPAAPTQPAASQPAPAQTEQPKRGGILRVGVQQLEAYLDPIEIKSGYTQHMLNSAFEPLIDFDANSNFVPALATAWQVGPDGKTITLPLRQNVKFHDGSPFNATVAKWNVDRFRDPKQNPDAGMFESVSSVEVVDANTIKLTLKQQDISLLYALSSYHACMIPPTALTVAADGKKGFKPIGTGAFKVEGNPTADIITVTRFDDYWDAAHTYLDKIVFNRIPDPTVRMSALRAGDVDIIDAPAAQDVPAAKADTSLAWMDRPGNIQYQVRFLVTKPPFDKPELRRAVGYAIDREAINKAALAGTGTPHQNIMYPSHWGYDPNFKGLSLDLDKAKDALQKGGQPNGFKFQMVMPNREPELTVAQAMKAQLIKVGIDMEIVSQDSAKAIAEFQQGMYASRLSGGSRTADPVNHLQEWGSDSSSNFYGYKSKDVDQLLTLLKVNNDKTARNDAMKKLNQIMIVDDAIFVRLVEQGDFKAWNAKLRGVAPEYSYPFRAYKFWWSDTPKPGAVKS